MKKIYFVSGNEDKYKEIKEIFGTCDYEIEYINYKLKELQTDDYNTLIRNKTLQAFKLVKRPVIVEHTMLCIDAFSGLPDVCTQNFFDKLGAEKICSFCSIKDEKGKIQNHAVAHSVIGFCDGKRIKIIDKKMEGEISEIYTKSLRDKKVFGWDGIFIPKCAENIEHQTLYELDLRGMKNEISMRRKALEGLKEYLTTNPVSDNEKLNEKYENHINVIAKLIKEGKLMLFVGAGISNSVSLPTWSDLIEQLGNELGYDTEIFECYGDYLLLAEYYKLCKGDTNLFNKLKEHLNVSDDKIKNSTIYQLIKKLNVPVIYTTNYDDTIERYYKMQSEALNVVESLEELRLADCSKTRLMKYHGTIKNDKSIVLSESQYFERMDFSSFLDKQLQKDWKDYSILYLGYSMSDINIKLLLYRLNKESGGKDIQSYIFTTKPNDIQDRVFENNNIIAIHNDIIDKELGTKKFLEDLAHKIDVIE